MSTRCTRCTILIKAKGDDAATISQFYHHHDGYPDFMGKFLKGLQTSSYNQEGDTLQLVIDNHKEFEKEDFGKVCHTDVEYVYVVDVRQEKVWCYRTSIDCLNDLVKIGLRIEHDSYADEIKVVFTRNDTKLY